MATISFSSGGAPGVFINERAGVGGAPALASFSTVYMLVEVDPAVPTTPEFFPFNTPIPVTSTREYVRRIGGVIPTEKLDLLSYQCVDSFFAQCYVGDLRVVRVGTPSNVLEVRFNPSGYKTNGAGASSTLQAGDVVYAQLLINGARLGEVTSVGTWKGVPIEIPVDYIPGNLENNRIIAKTIRDAVSAAIAVDPNISASVIVRSEGMCTGETDECSYLYLTGRTFNAPVSCVPESIPGNGSFFVLTLNTYDVEPVNPSNDRVEEAVSDYTQCVRTAFVDAEEQGYLCAPVAFEKFGPSDRRVLGNLMGAVCEEKKWMALVDAGAYAVTDILQYASLQQMKAADRLVQGSEILCENTVYEWTADTTDYLQLKYVPLSKNEVSPKAAVTQSQNVELPPSTFLSLKDDGLRNFQTPGPAPYDKPGVVYLEDGIAWPETKAPGTPISLSGCVGSDELEELDGQIVYIVPTFFNQFEQSTTAYVYFAATYPAAITCYDYVVAQGGLDNVNTLPPGALPLDAGLSGGFAEYVTGITILNPGDGYETAPVVTFNTPLNPAGRAATATTTLKYSDGQVNSVAIDYAGQGYTNTPTVKISDVGGGVNATASALVATSGGLIADLALTTTGSGYLTAPTVSISAPAAVGGVAAEAYTTLQSVGYVYSVDLVSGGQGYSVAPTVSFNGPGTGAKATANLASTGSVVKLALSFPGNDYTATPSVAINGVGSGATGTATLAPTGRLIGPPTITSNGLYGLPPTVTAPGGTHAAFSATLAGLGSAGKLVYNGWLGTPGATGTITLEGAGAETDIVLGWSAGPTGTISFSISQAGSGWTSGGPNSVLNGTYGTLINSNPGAVLQFGTMSIRVGFPIATLLGGGGNGYTGSAVNLLFTPDALDQLGSGVISAAASCKVGYAVASLTLTGVGSGYNSTTSVAITPAAGDTTGGGASGTATVGYAVSSVTVDIPGFGYDETSTVSLNPDAGDTTGVGAQAVPDIAYGVLDLILANPGSGYAASDTVSVTFADTPSATSATAVAKVGYPLSAINVTTNGTNYKLDTIQVQVVANPLDAGNTISPAVASAVLGYPVAKIDLVDLGSGYSPTDQPVITVANPDVGTKVCTAEASLQKVGVGLLTYDPGAWDLEVEIEGQTSDLIMNVTTQDVSMNTLHLPGTLQKSTEDYNLKQFTRQFAVANITTTPVTNYANFNCLNHGLASGEVIFFTKNLVTSTTPSQVFVARSSSTSLKQYFVFVVDANNFYLADTATNLNSRNFLRYKPLAAGQTTLAYGKLLLAPENTGSYSNDGVVNLIRGRKYGFNTASVYANFFPADVNPATAPSPQGPEHYLGFFNGLGTTNADFFSANGESSDAGFLGELQLQGAITANFYCVPTVENARYEQEYITPYYGSGSTRLVLWGSTLKLRYTPYVPAPSSLFRFDAITATERMDYALRGTFNNGVPEAIVLARGVDDTGELLKDSQQYLNAKGFIAYYGPYVLNEDDAYIPPSPLVAGVAIRRYRSEGYQYPPAGVKYQLNGIKEAQIPVNSTQQDILNPQGCNVLRTLPGYGYYDRQNQRYVGPVFIWGGRTRINQDDAEQRLYQFVNTRVILNVVYGSLRNAFDSQIFNVIDGFGLVFNKIISIGNSVLNEIYVRGALFGNTPGQAFQVICDRRINPDTSLENGIVNAKVFVTPVPTLERIQIDLIRVAIGNMQNELDFAGVGEGNQL